MKINCNQHLTIRISGLENLLAVKPAAEVNSAPGIGGGDRRRLLLILGERAVLRFERCGSGGGDGGVSNVDTVGASLCATGTQLLTDSLVSTIVELSLLLPSQNRHSTSLDILEKLALPSSSSMSDCVNLTFKSCISRLNVLSIDGCTAFPHLFGGCYKTQIIYSSFMLPGIVVQLLHIWIQQHMSTVLNPFMTNAVTFCEK